MIINGIKWRIFFVAPDHPMLCDCDCALGVCDEDLHAIYIRLDLPRYKLKKVLSHEIVHASMFSYNITMSIEQEEMVADLIATFGQEILSNANEIFKNLTE